MVIFDIDGFVVNIDDRRKRILSGRKNNEIDWTEFFNGIQKDKPIKSGILIVKAFINYLPQVDIMFLTGRTEYVRYETLKWLSDKLEISENKIDLTMRPENNFDEDYVFKEKVGAELGFRNIKLVFDDNEKIIDMWRSHNVPCCQFNAGEVNNG